MTGAQSNGRRRRYAQESCSNPLRWDLAPQRAALRATILLARATAAAAAAAAEVAISAVAALTVAAGVAVVVATADAKKVETALTTVCSARNSKTRRRSGVASRAGRTAPSDCGTTPSPPSPATIAAELGSGWEPPPSRAPPPPPPPPPPLQHRRPPLRRTLSSSATTRVRPAVVAVARRRALLPALPQRPPGAASKPRNTRRSTQRPPGAASRRRSSRAAP